MKCLTNEQIQRWIDGETLPQETAMVEQHLAVCPVCSRKAEQQRNFARHFKAVMAYPAAGFDIPAFDVPEKKEHETKKVFRIPLWAKIAAVMVPALLIWKFKPNKIQEFHPSPKDVLMQQACTDVDANTAFQQNMIIMTETDEHGNPIECSTN